MNNSKCRWICLYFLLYKCGSKNANVVNIDVKIKGQLEKMLDSWTAERQDTIFYRQLAIID